MTLDTFIRIGELVGAAVLGGWVSRILTIRSRVRQEGAAADKAETEVKADQIENIEKLVEKVYKPTIDTLAAQVRDLRAEVDAVRKENEELKAENAQLRDAIREIQPDLVPSKKSVQARGQARGVNGRFVKKEEAEA